VEERSIVEALDELPPADWRGPAGQELSAAGRRRLDRLGAVLRDLRGRVGLTLPDLVLDVERALLLDVEVAARPGVRPGVARAHLDAFVDVAAGFAAQSGQQAQQSRAGGGPGGAGVTAAGSGPGTSGLTAFLRWLAAADQRERGLDAPVTQVREDAVQVLTVHAAKGLEWDVVAVPGLVEGTFPSGRNGRAPSLSNGWLGELGAVPYPLRGDAPGLPRWAVEGATTQPELETALQEFREHCGAHEIAEERRLAYVAVTRARQRLLLTGAVWGDGTTPRTPSRFLLEVAALAEDGVPGVSVGEWAAGLGEGAANPRDALTPSALWPTDPLGDRRPAVEEGAALVREALAAAAAAAQAAAAEPEPDDMTWHVAGPAPAPEAEDAWAREVRQLLAERDATGRRDIDVALPPHLSASRVVALAADPVALAARLRRPMPEPPSPHARRGSAFHAWLEQRFGSAALVDIDELPGAADDAAGDEELAALQQRFLASPWADLSPEAVEVSVETPVAGVVVRGRIDAVFRYDGPRWDVVDWKTGAPPRTERDAFARAVQLAVYRLAWARLNGVDVDLVGAAFFYAGTGETVRPVDLLDARGLAGLVAAATSGDAAEVRGPGPAPRRAGDPDPR
jgi:DNA helicase-2/ATP-dependent DNA helicase PcrA